MAYKRTSKKFGTSGRVTTNQGKNGTVFSTSRKVGNVRETYSSDGTVTTTRSLGNGWFEKTSRKTRLGKKAKPTNPLIKVFGLGILVVLLIVHFVGTL